MNWRKVKFAEQAAWRKARKRIARLERWRRRDSDREYRRLREEPSQIGNRDRLLARLSERLPNILEVVIQRQLELNAGTPFFGRGEAFLKVLFGYAATTDAYIAAQAIADQLGMPYQEQDEAYDWLYSWSYTSPGCPSDKPEERSGPMTVQTQSWAAYRMVRHYNGKHFDILPPTHENHRHRRRH